LLNRDDNNLDLNARNSDGFTPLDIAEKYDNYEAQMMLLLRGAKNGAHGSQLKVSL